MSFTTEIEWKQYTANGSTSVFAFPYLFLENAHLVVIRTNLDGSEDLLVLDTDYSLTGAEDPSGGNVTIITGNPAAGVKITIYRDVDTTQPDDYPSGLTYFLPTLEKSYDKIVMMIQRLKARLDKTIGRGPTDTASVPTVDELLELINAAGDGVLASYAKVNQVGGVSKGDFLYDSGASNGITQVGLADNTVLAKARVFGCAAEDGANGDTILVYRAGNLSGLDTSGFSSEGSSLYLITAGQVQEAKPTTGLVISVGSLIKIDASEGTFNIDPQSFTYNVAHSAKKGRLDFTIDGGGSVIPTGEYKFDTTAPYKGRVTVARLLADQSGDAVVDIWKKAFPTRPTVADTITAAAKPTLSSAETYEDDTLSGWTVEFNEGDWFVIKIDLAATLTRLKTELDTQREF